MHAFQNTANCISNLDITRDCWSRYRRSLCDPHCIVANALWACCGKHRKLWRSCYYFSDLSPSLPPSLYTAQRPNAFCHCALYSRREKSDVTSLMRCRSSTLLARQIKASEFEIFLRILNNPLKLHFCSSFERPPHFVTLVTLPNIFDSDKLNLLSSTTAWTAILLKCPHVLHDKTGHQSHSAHQVSSFFEARIFMSIDMYTRLQRQHDAGSLHCICYVCSQAMLLSIVFSQTVTDKRKIRDCI